MTSLLLTLLLTSATWSYQAAPGPLNNPLKGWCPFAEEPVKADCPASMAYLNVSWRVLEPERGHYAFEKWEHDTWELPGAKGKNIVFRVFLDYPGQASGVPDWLVKGGLKMTKYTEYGGGLSPDYTNPDLQKGLIALIKQLGQRYSRNARVPFIEIGILGFWGEWHTYPLTELFAPEAFQKQVIASMRENFPSKQLLARNPGGAAGSETQLGFHDDMIPQDTLGPEDWQFLPSLVRAGRAENWKTSPRGGEMVPAELQSYATTKLSTTLKAIEQVHFSWIGPACPPILAQTPELMANEAAIVRKLGYQFRLIAGAAKVHKGEVTLNLQAVNEGVAPFYYPWDVKLALLDAKGTVTEAKKLNVDIRTWLPGSFKIQANVKFQGWKGSRTLALGIMDPYRGRPNVDFANKITQRGGWQFLGTVSSSE